jgi:hypothetical protein
VLEFGAEQAVREGVELGLAGLSAACRLDGSGSGLVTFGEFAEPGTPASGRRTKGRVVKQSSRVVDALAC